MKPNPSRDAWSRLTTAARTAPHEEREIAVPYGFATRVTALAFAQERAPVSLFDRLAMRALGVACLLALGSLALNYQVLVSTGAPGSAVTVGVDDFGMAAPADDAVALVFDVAD
jgi:hypothetical protein